MWAALALMLIITLWFALQALPSVALTLFLRFGNSCTHIGLFGRRTGSCGQATVKCMNSPRIKDEKQPPQQGVVPSHPQPTCVLTSMHQWSPTPFSKGELGYLKRGYGFSLRQSILLQPSMSQEKEVGFKDALWFNTLCLIFQVAADCFAPYSRDTCLSTDALGATGSNRGQRIPPGEPGSFEMSLRQCSSPPVDLTISV